MSDAAKRFGAALAEALGEGPGKGALPAQRERLLAALAARRRWSARRVAPVLAAAAILASLPVVHRLLDPSKPAVTASVDGRALASASTIEAPASSASVLDFSDGSQLVLEPKSQASVTTLTGERAHLRLQAGQLRAQIRKRTGMTWTIDAGPYAIRVVGTTFRVHWDETRGRLRVDVEEGRVQISGRGLPAPGLFVDAGGSLEQLEPRASREPAAPVPDSATEPSVGPSTPGAPPPGPAKASPTPPPDWLALAGAAKYREAVVAAEALGFEELVARLPANDLLTLANAARYSGARGRARQALRGLRQRFPGSAPARLGALALARLAEDGDKDPAAAARWLRTFLKESPTGDLAAGARADLMSLSLRLGDAAAARAVARDYLRHHPRGPHATQARELIQSTPSK